MPARTPAPVRGGAVDADLLRERWPDVLDVVKGQRRIAWMLLGPATVDSLENGVLTVAFPKEGEAKGFASSGCDQVLASALTTLLGLNVRVRAVVGGGSTGGGPRGSTRPAAAPGSGHGPRNPAAPDTDTPADAAGEPSAAAETPPAAEVPAPEVPAPETAPGVPQPRGAQASGRAASAAPTGQDASGPARRAATSGRRGRAAKDSGTAPAAPDAGFDEEEWPDDAGPAGAGPGPTGMELIERQLGGRVIEEIEEP